MNLLSKAFLFITLFSLMAGFASCSHHKRGELKNIWYNGSYNRDFNDLNDLQVAEAIRLGITPLSAEGDVLKASKKMVEIKSGEYYDVEELKHSVPYLIPEAADLLEAIGKNFQDTLVNLNAPVYRILVTSVTRTGDNMSSLKKKNRNTTDNSAHQYGTTFDVSWNRFTKVDPEDTLDIDKDHLKMVLAMVLRDLRNDSLCYVKHERKQGCFHITAREPHKK